MTIWIVCHAKRGFLQEPEVFFSISEADKRMQELRQDYNPDYDEFDIFEKEIIVNHHI